MLTAIIVAVIAAVASLVTVVFTWKQSLAIKRIEANTQERLAVLNGSAIFSVELLKDTNERARKAFEMAITDSSPAIDALDNCWRSMQTAKDLITKLSQLAEREVEQQELTDFHEKFRDATSEFLEVYRTSGPNVPTSIRPKLHDVKLNLTLGEELLARMILEQFPRRISANVLDIFLSKKASLTRMQGLITTVRSRVIETQYERYLEISLPPRNLEGIQALSESLRIDSSPAEKQATDDVT